MSISNFITADDRHYYGLYPGCQCNSCASIRKDFHRAGWTGCIGGLVIATLITAFAPNAREYAGIIFWGITWYVVYGAMKPSTSWREDV